MSCITDRCNQGRAACPTPEICNNKYLGWREQLWAGLAGIGFFACLIAIIATLVWTVKP